MSMMLMARVMQIKVGNPLRKLVLIKLADNANDAGECWPSYQHIADQCEIGRSTVRKHIKDLEAQGFLIIENRKGPKGNSSNLYRLRLSAPVAPDSTPVAPDSTPIAPDSTPPVAPDSTRTYHSFEPIKDPIVCNKSHAVCNESHTTDSVDAAFEIFWSAGMRKINKKRALTLFAGLCKRKKLDPAQFAEQLASDVRKRLAAQQMGFDRLHPTTYLSNERWDDELVSDAPGSAAPSQSRSNYNCPKCGAHMDDCICWAENINEGVFA